ncbi:MAG: FlaD/FlaE family flagellar protein, partial [Thermoplasmata archaeon]
YLRDKVDLNELPQVLDYYRRINWISNEVKADILWKIKGIKIEKKPTKPETKDGWRLSINDHLKNLMFIEMLRGTQLDKLTLEELEKEMEKLKKSNLEDFYGL